MQICNNISPRKVVKKLNVNRVTDFWNFIIKIVCGMLKETLIKYI